MGTWWKLGGNLVASFRCNFGHVHLCQEMCSEMMNHGQGSGCMAFLRIFRGGSGITQNRHFDNVLTFFRKSRKSPVCLGTLNVMYGCDPTDRILILILAKANSRWIDQKSTGSQGFASFHAHTHPPKARSSPGDKLAKFKN